MICAVHQPNYIPYLGFFDKYKKADVFVLYDTAQYSKNDFHNRNRIKTAAGPHWLTIPVTVHLGQEIREVSVADSGALDKHLDVIRGEYKDADRYRESIAWLSDIYGLAEKSSRLADLNIAILKNFFELFRGAKKVVLASELGLDPDLKSTDALVALCRKVGADEYLSGSGAHTYLEEKKFKDAAIKVSWHEFRHPVYKQQYGEFIPDLSVVDALMNVGMGGLRTMLE